MESAPWSEKRDRLMVTQLLCGHEPQVEGATVSDISLFDSNRKGIMPDRVPGRSVGARGGLSSYASSKDHDMYLNEP